MMRSLLQNLNASMSISPSQVSGLWKPVLDNKFKLIRRVGLFRGSESATREFNGQDGTVKLNNSRSPVVESLTVKSQAKSQEELIIEIKSIKPPEFSSPYPSRQNRHAAKAVANSFTWFDQQSLPTVLSDPTKMQKFIRGRVNEFFTGIYVDAEEEEMSWLCCYSLWGFLLDDLMDEILYTSSPDKSAPIFVEMNMLMMWSFPDDPTLYATLLELIYLFPVENREAMLNNIDAKLANARLHPGSAYDTSHLGPMIRSFKDLWEKLSAAPPESLIRWGNSMQRYFLGNLRETKNRKQGDVPSIIEYIANRRDTSAVEPCMLIVEYAEKFTTSLPLEVFESQEMKYFLDALNDIHSWHNDIYSFKKELLDGEVHNLVFLISHERGSSFSDALAIALGMLQGRLQDLDRAIVNLEAISTPESQSAVKAYIKTAQYWVSGTHDFTIRSKRYH